MVVWVNPFRNWLLMLLSLLFENLEGQQGELLKNALGELISGQF